MKSKFIKISKIFLSCFAATIAIIVAYAIFTKDQDIALPNILGIFIIITTAMAGVCILIAWIMDIVENIKRKDLTFFVGYIVSIVILGFVMAVGEYYLGEHVFELAAWLRKSCFIVCAMRAGNYIFSKN